MGSSIKGVRFFSCHTDTMQAEESYRLQVKESMAKNRWAGDIVGFTGVTGLRLDFNCGLRLQLPTGEWHVRISDVDTEMVFFDGAASAEALISLELYYIHWQVEVYRREKLVYSHVFDPRGQKVFFAVADCAALGDALAFLPYLKSFRDAYGAEISCYAPAWLQGIFRRFLPSLAFHPHIPADAYATYYFNSGMERFVSLPMDGRQVPLWQVGRLTLGMGRPAGRLPYRAGKREIPEPYVCIGVQASTPAKGWLYPGGWDEVCRYLKSMGYRVLCIDREPYAEQGGVAIRCPAEAEDRTGDISLEARADMLAHAEFFVGLSSGLAWLADAVGCPVVMIAGFSNYWYEFAAAYRVYNPFACQGCLNDIRENYVKNACPRHRRDSPHFLECSRLISPRQVMAAIDRLREDKRRAKII